MRYIFDLVITLPGTCLLFRNVYVVIFLGLLNALAMSFHVSIHWRWIDFVCMPLKEVSGRCSRAVVQNWLVWYYKNRCV